LSRIFTAVVCYYFDLIVPVSLFSQLASSQAVQISSPGQKSVAAWPFLLQTLFRLRDCIIYIIMCGFLLSFVVLSGRFKEIGRDNMFLEKPTCDNQSSGIGCIFLVSWPNLVPNSGMYPIFDNMRRPFLPVGLS
jgi:hypothetical protein